MANQEEEDLKMVQRLSMQHSPPEPKQSKSKDAAAAAAGGSLSEDGRRMQRELMAAAIEKRMLATRSAGAMSPSSPAPSPSQSPSPMSTTPNNKKSKAVPRRDGGFCVDDGRTGRRLSSEEAHQLFSMVFGGEEAHQLIFFVDPQFVPDSIGFALHMWQLHKA